MLQLLRYHYFTEMAGSQVAFTNERTIQDLPDEMLLKIFSNLSCADLESGVANVSPRWSNLAEDKLRRANLKVAVKYLKRSLDIPDLTQKNVENHDVHKIRITSKGKRSSYDRYEDAENEFIRGLSRNTIFLFRNLRTLYLETFSDRSFHQVSMASLLEHSALETVSLISRYKNNSSSDEFDLQVTFSTADKNLNLLTKNVRWNLCWDHLMANWSHNIIGFVEVKGPNLAVMESELNNPRSLIFEDLCRNCSRLQKLSFNIPGYISSDQFSNILMLEDLSFLALTMDYSFSRKELTEVYEKSNFSRSLCIKIIERQSKGQPEHIALKNSLVNIYFIPQK